MEASNLAVFWASVIAASIMIYVILDGFDLGVGVLFGFTRDTTNRLQMINTIAPFWDGNETWLVIVGASLFAAFPAVYTVFLGAFYIPVLADAVRPDLSRHRVRVPPAQPAHDAGFGTGDFPSDPPWSLCPGSRHRRNDAGIPVVDGHFAGNTYDWVHPFPILTGIGLVLGYALLGAGWIVYKSEDALRDWAYARIPWLALGVFVVMGLAFTATMTLDAGPSRRTTAVAQLGSSRFRSWPVVALIGVVLGARARRDSVPFALTTLFFIACYLTLGVMFWPYMVPYSVTVASAAAPDESLGFFFYGGVIVLPMILIYTLGVYRVFRGKRHRGYS